MSDRINEVLKHLKDMEIDPTTFDMRVMLWDLDALAGGPGCIGPGGSAVRHWIQRWLVDHDVLRPAGEMANTQVVTATLHFWSWDEDKFGPWVEDARTRRLETQRSPVWRLVDATPIDRVADRVTKDDA